MTSIQSFLITASPVMESLAAITGLLYYNRLKHTYWKWFVYYLILIALSELFSLFVLENFPSFKKFYYNTFIIPTEFLFFFWLYAYKSLEKKKLFWISSFIYVATFTRQFYYLEETRKINSISYTVGVLLLLIMIFLEFNKQISSDSILQFQKNKMFYINIGVLLFYIGTLPFFAFESYSYEYHKTIWTNYLTFYLIMNPIMYLLFSASFIWGKPTT